MSSGFTGRSNDFIKRGYSWEKLKLCLIGDGNRIIDSKVGSQKNIIGGNESMSNIQLKKIIGAVLLAFLILPGLSITAFAKDTKSKGEVLHQFLLWQKVLILWSKK